MIKYQEKKVRTNAMDVVIMRNIMGLYYMSFYFWKRKTCRT